jgi:hypothetical protein
MSKREALIGVAAAVLGLAAMAQAAVGPVTGSKAACRCARPR